VTQTFEVRIANLERSLLHVRLVAAFLVFVTTGSVLSGFSPAHSANEVRTKRLVVVDDRGRVRAVIGQDAASTQRRSRAAGLTLYDSAAVERGGFSTMDDGSVVLGMDAPRGVGSPMRDRLGLLVMADGAAHVMLIDNSTRAVAKLHSDGSGGGGVQVFKWNMATKTVGIRTLTYDGELRDSVPFGK